MMSVASAFDCLPPALRTSVIERGFTELTPVQKAVSEARSSGRNLRVCSQTGSGKTLAIGLILADRLIEADAEAGAPSALVLVPTRELAQQVHAELSWLFAAVDGFAAVVVTGGTDIQRERRALARRPRLVVATPGRCLDHLRAGAFDGAAVTQVVLDEADQMLDMGFRDELDAIVEALPESRASHLVSATFPDQVRRFAKRFQGDALELTAGDPSGEHADIEHVAHRVEFSQRYEALVNCLLFCHTERCLVFVKRRCDAAEVAEALSAEGFAALPLSGDLPQAQRTRTLQAFRTGTVKTLIATDIAARGIDVADISTVVHYDLPADGEVYVHRSGRTGRAGQQGRSVLLVTPSAQARVERGLRSLSIEPTWMPVPSPAKIHRRLRKSARRRLHEALAQGLDALEERELIHAREMLEAHDPAALVASCLRLAQDQLPREPQDLPEAPAYRGRDRGRDASYTQFSINWGRDAGANPSRVVAHVCRRTGIPSRFIGSIAIRERHSTFEVESRHAEKFSDRAARPDARDPHLHIRPASERTGSARPPRGPSGAGGHRALHRRERPTSRA